LSAIDMYRDDKEKKSKKLHVCDENDFTGKKLFAQPYFILF